MLYSNQACRGLACRGRAPQGSIQLNARSLHTAPTHLYLYDGSIWRINPCQPLNMFAKMCRLKYQREIQFVIQRWRTMFLCTAACGSLQTATAMASAVLIVSPSLLQQTPIPFHSWKSSGYAKICKRIPICVWPAKYVSSVMSLSRRSANNSKGDGLVGGRLP